MSLEMFVEQVIETMEKKLPEGWKNAKLLVVNNNKVNGEKIGIQFDRPDLNCCPIIYMEEFFERYQRENNPEFVIDSILEILRDENIEKMNKLSTFDYENSKDQIILHLINTKENEEILKDVPHRAFHDLSIVYQWVLLCDKDDFASMTISSEFAEHYDLSEEQLYQLAMENMRRLFPVIVKPMSQTVKEILEKHGVEEGEMTVHEGECKCHVVTNSIKSFGAAAMLFPDELHKIAEKLEDDLYIIPTSRHALVVTPQNEVTLEQLIEMVEMSNYTSQREDDILSFQAYQYNRETREVTMATNLPDRSFAEQLKESKIEEVKERSARR